MTTTVKEDVRTMAETAYILKRLDNQEKAILDLLVALTEVSQKVSKQGE